MITVKFHKNKDNFVYGFEVKGHAGYAPSGSDIICSAVSALAHTAIGSFLDLTEYRIKYEISEAEGYMKCEIIDIDNSNRDDRITAEVLMKSFEIGCRQIINSYGKKYLKVVNSSFNK